MLQVFLTTMQSKIKPFQMFRKRLVLSAIAFVTAITLILLNSFSILDASANQPQLFNTFVEQCENREILSLSIKTTIESMLQAIDPPTSNCTEANDRLSQLRQIVLSAEQDMDLSPLRFFHNITFLVLFNDQMNDFSSLQSLTHLAELSIFSYQIMNLRPLEALSNLRSLSIISRQITNLDPLRSLTNLAFLNLKGNQITDISPLRSLTNLRYLFLFDNHINDLSSLRSLTNLTELSLSNNQIADLSP